MSNELILLTASPTLCAPMLEVFEDKFNPFLHLPLEEFETDVQDETSGYILKHADAFTFVIYGNLRNAIHFVNWIDQTDSLQTFQKLIHLVLDKPTAAFLEKNTIPAVMPKENARPIDLLEFMLRISREGKTLYPTADQQAEEMPGLLQELEMPVNEFPVCSEKTLATEQLERYRIKLKEIDPSVVLFHNRSSITRINTAFPGMNFQSKKIISGSAGVTKSLIDIGLEPDIEAEGTWSSIGDVVEQETG